MDSALQIMAHVLFLYLDIRMESNYTQSQTLNDQSNTCMCNEVGQVLGCH